MRKHFWFRHTHTINGMVLCYYPFLINNFYLIHGSTPHGRDFDKVYCFLKSTNLLRAISEFFQEIFLYLSGFNWKIMLPNCLESLCSWNWIFNGLSRKIPLLIESFYSIFGEEFFNLFVGSWNRQIVLNCGKYLVTQSD